jgi:hypothetical protein
MSKSTNAMPEHRFLKLHLHLILSAMLWLVIAFGASAQEEMYRDIRIKNFGTTFYFKPPLNGVIGSPLLYDVWFSGHLIMKEDSSRFDAAFLYDASADMMLFIAGADTQMILKPLLIDHIEFANMKFIYALEVSRSAGQDMLKGGYYQVMAGDSIVLLQKTLKYLEENRSINNYMGGGGDGRPRYITTRTYYYQTPGGSATPLLRTKKGLLELSPYHRNELKEFMKTNRTNPQKLADLLAFFEYLNTL